MGVVNPAAPGRGREEQGAAVVLAGSAGGPPACRAARRGSPGMRAGGPRSQGSHARTRRRPCESCQIVVRKHVYFQWFVIFPWRTARFGLCSGKCLLWAEAAMRTALRILLLLVGVVVVLAAAVAGTGYWYVSRLTAESPTPTADPDTQRRIETGEIVGFADRARTQAWLGIPYAAPPVAALRWRAPRPPVPWSDVRPMLTTGSQCPQPVIFPGGPSVAGEGRLSIPECLDARAFPRTATGDVLDPRRRQPHRPGRQPALQRREPGRHAQRCRRDHELPARSAGLALTSRVARRRESGRRLRQLWRAGHPARA